VGNRGSAAGERTACANRYHRQTVVGARTLKAMKTTVFIDLAILGDCRGGRLKTRFSRLASPMTPGTSERMEQSGTGKTGAAWKEIGDQNEKRE